METRKPLTRKEAMQRFMAAAAKERKNKCVEKMKAELASMYEQRTGKR